MRHRHLLGFLLHFHEEQCLAFPRGFELVAHFLVLQLSLLRLSPCICQLKPTKEQRKTQGKGQGGRGGGAERGRMGQARVSGMAARRKTDGGASFRASAWVGLTELPKPCPGLQPSPDPGSRCFGWHEWVRRGNETHRPLQQGRDGKEQERLACFQACLEVQSFHFLFQAG